MDNNVIEFPMKRRMQEIADEREELQIEFEFFADECREAAQLVLMMMEEFFANDASSFDELDFRDSLMPESRDAFVIVNLISSMLLRYGGAKHFLQEYLDVIYEKLMDTK